MVISAYFSLDFPKNIGKKSEEMEKKKMKKKIETKKGKSRKEKTWNYYKWTQVV